MSDLHLEFQGHKPIEFPDADVLVLAGDILVAEDLRRHSRDDVVLPHEQPRGVSAQRYREFLDQVTQRYQHVVWVAGNHEFYHGKFNQTLKVLFDECIFNYLNLHFLEDSWVDVEDVRFLGGTLWTDCNNHDPLTMMTLQHGMNDYRIITNDEAGYTKLRPVHTLQRHIKTRQFIEQNVTQKTVVITHHAPSPQSIAPEFQNEHHLNGGYASNLHELILDHRPQYWLHGHMHHQQDYRIGETRILCNPRGYPHQNPYWTPRVYHI
jgi:Icc-related predicted phosphoesterase